MITLIDNLSTILFISTYIDKYDKRQYRFRKVKVGTSFNQDMFCNEGYWEIYLTGIMDRFDKPKWGL